MKNVSVNQFVEMLKNREIQGKTSAGFSMIKTVTQPKLNKKSRVTGLPLPYQNVSKYTKSFCLLNSIYQNSMNAKLTKEGYQDKGDNYFVSEPLPFGEWEILPNGKTSKILIKHKDQYYIRAQFNLNIKPETQWIADGNQIDKSDLIDYLPPEKENYIEVRTFKAESIKEISLDHEIYIIE